MNLQEDYVRQDLQRLLKESIAKAHHLVGELQELLRVSRKKEQNVDVQGKRMREDCILQEIRRLEESIGKGQNLASASEEQLNNVENIENINLILKEIDKRMTLTIQLPKEGVCADIDSISTQAAKKTEHLKTSSLITGKLQNSNHKTREDSMKIDNSVESEYELKSKSPSNEAAVQKYSKVGDEIRINFEMDADED